MIGCSVSTGFFFIFNGYTICWTGEGANLLICTALESFRSEEGAISENSAALGSVVANPVCDSAVNCVPDLM